MHLGRKVAAPLIGLALAGGGFAFLASNNVGTSYAGTGTNTISGYNVSNVHYQYMTSSQGGGSDYIADVTFTLDNPATTVSATITDGYVYAYNSCLPATAADAAANTFTCYTSFDAPGSGSSITPNYSIQTTPYSDAQASGSAIPTTLNASPVGGNNTLSVTAVE